MVFTVLIRLCGEESFGVCDDSEGRGFEVFGNGVEYALLVSHLLDGLVLLVEGG